ncbi:MAG: class I SAM-dependent methyltransferase [Alphaproteobacteria bacterium]
MNLAERLVETAEHFGPVLATVDGFDVIDCRACGFRHIDPLFSDEELKKFYDGEFYEKERPDYFARAEADKAWWMLRYHHYFELLEAHAPKPGQARRLLDIGSGPGYFLEAGRDRGWDVLGFEPSRIAAEYTAGRGIAVVNDFFSAGKAKGRGLFDAVSMNLVLEHLRDPIALVEEAKAMLAPGGLLFVSSPNDFNPLQMVLWQKMGLKPWWVVPKHHLNYFDHESARRFFTARGLKTLHQEGSYPLENFILSGRNYVGNDVVGRACHAERKAFETALFTHDKAQIKALAKSWMAQGIGREFIILGQKP